MITLYGQYYRIHGFPLAMQIWMYACCFIVNRKIARKLGNHIPRILNWHTKTVYLRCDFIMNVKLRGTRKKV